MKAITIHQPWATLIMLGAKKIETRSWPTKLRGTIAIHSSRTFTPEQEKLCDRLRFSSALRPAAAAKRYMIGARTPWRDILDLGHILGTVELLDCRPTKDLRGEINTDDDEWAFGDFSDGPGGFGRHGFILGNPGPIKWPIPVRGAQGFWEISAPQLESLSERLVRTELAS